VPASARRSRLSRTRQRQRYEGRARIRHVAGTKIESARVLALSNLSWGSLMEPRESLRPGALTRALKLQPVPITRAVIRSAGRVAADSSGCCETTNYRLLPAKSCGTISDPEVDVRICARDGNSPAVNANNAKHPGRQIGGLSRDLHDLQAARGCTVAHSLACSENSLALLRAAIRDNRH